MPTAFLVGAGYLGLLARDLYALRRERANFQREMILLGAVFLIAIAVSVLGFVPSLLPGKTFFAIYAIAIGIAFLLVQTALGFRPALSVELGESAQRTYATSTLNNVDAAGALTKLESLMQLDRLFTDSELSLARLAEQLNLSTHQTSELLNVRLGKSFARYLRERRVGAAKTMLVDEPSASVLSVGLSIGFTSQSNFYEAFREIEGMTPGQFRKMNTSGGKAD